MKIMTTTQYFPFFPSQKFVSLSKLCNFATVKRIKTMVKTIANITSKNVTASFRTLRRRGGDF